jgi:hypothetical protein
MFEDVVEQNDTPSTTRRGAIKAIAGVAGVGVGIVPLSGQVSARSNTVRVENYHSDKALSSYDWANGSHRNVDQWDYDGHDAQKWHVSEVGSKLKFENVYSGKCLEVAGAATHNGANVREGDYHGDSHQLWINRSDATIENANSGKVLDVSEWSTENGANIIQWEDSGGANQQWSFLSP